MRTFKTAGIIAEYNPLHTGHSRHIALTRARTGADFCIVVMSPDFVQRGEPAVFDKFIRTRMALAAGADLVLELPVCWACSSAEYFAEGAVRLLDALGCVDHLCFGSETEDLSLFEQAAGVLLSETPVFSDTLRSHLALGETFPAARAAAVRAAFGENGLSAETKDALETILSSSNAILGLEYVKAIRKARSPIVPVPVLREGSAYASSSLDGPYVSALALRAELQRSADPSGILPYIPEACRDMFRLAVQTPVSVNDFTSALRYLFAAEADTADILDFPPSLARRVRNYLPELCSLSAEEMIDLLKTRQVTRAGVSRALLHLMLGLTASGAKAWRDAGMVFYARVLGFRKNAQPLLHEIKKAGSVPLLTTPSSAQELLCGEGLSMYRTDRRASHLYRSILAGKYGVPFKAEETCPVITLP